MLIDIPESVSYILGRLREASEEAYIVGGCVRDAMMGRAPHDYDITTSALPQKVKRLFERTIDTGLEHGTVTVLIDKEAYEVTTYRVDGTYEDHRRPKAVNFSVSLEEDLLRRDFTINAMAYNEEKGLIDLYEGQKDLTNRNIRCVGRAEDRFNEDALRMLRAIRFSAKLDFQIENETYQAIKTCAKLIKHVSQERIQIEMEKTLCSENPERIKELELCGLLGYLIEQLAGNIDETIYKALKKIPPLAHLRWAIYLMPLRRTMDDSKKMQNCLKNLKFDNKTNRRITRLILEKEVEWKAQELDIRKEMSRLGLEVFMDIIKVKTAFVLSDPEYKKEDFDELIQIENIAKNIVSRGDCLSIKDLSIDGRAIMKYGIKDGQKIGQVLAFLLDRVLEEPESNNEEALKAMVNEWRQEDK